MEVRMPRFSPVGDVWAGIGDNIVSLNGIEVARGGAACALDAQGGIYQIRSSLYVYNVQGRTQQLIDSQGANDLRAGNGIYEATFNNVLRISNPPGTYPGCYCGDVGFDGTCLIIGPDGMFQGQPLITLQSV